MNEDTIKTIITHQSEHENAFIVLEDMGTWPELLIEYAKVLNKAGYFIPIDIVEDGVYNTIVKNHRVRLDEQYKD
jgi:hypothetical protein